MVSNRRMGMVGFIEHAAFGLGFLAFFVFIGLPFAMKGSTHWGFSFLIYMMTFGNLMYLSASLSAYGKSMLTDSNFDVDIGEMYDILSNVKVFKIIFMIIPLSIIGIVLSPFALITMILNIKTFFKKNQDYLDEIDEEWDRRESVWDAETEQMKKESKDRISQKKRERALEKEELKKRENDKKEQEQLDSIEKNKEINKKEIQSEKVKVEKKEVGFIRFKTGGWDANVSTPIYHDGTNYICYMGKGREERKTSSFDEMITKFKYFHKNNKEFKIHDIKKY